MGCLYLQVVSFHQIFLLLWGVSKRVRTVPDTVAFWWSCISQILKNCVIVFLSNRREDDKLARLINSILAMKDQVFVNNFAIKVDYPLNLIGTIVLVANSIPGFDLLIFKNSL
jgi:hypothetical protein